MGDDGREGEEREGEEGAGGGTGEKNWGGRGERLTSLSTHSHFHFVPLNNIR